jgi:hypothetical protein
MAASQLNQACDDNCSSANSWNYLKQTSSGYNIPVATFTANTTQALTWVGHDLGAATVALLTHHTDPSKGVLGSAYPVISFVCTYTEVAAAIAKGEFSFDFCNTKEDDFVQKSGKK